MSLDKASLEVTENLKDIASATRVAQGIRASIRFKTSLTLSSGASCNKFLTKLASDHRKPDGLFIILPGIWGGVEQRGDALLKPLCPVARAFGSRASLAVTRGGAG